MNEQELKSLINVYQRRLNEANAQSIAFEVRTLIQQELINDLQRQLEEAPKRSTKKVDTAEF
jgi:hypothetical protein